MLAMLFLVLFGTMAVGFYAATNVSMQVSSNDDHVARAFLASESGLDFMKHQLAHVNVSPASTSVDDVTNDLLASLQNNMDGVVIAKSASNVIQVPANNTRIKLDSGNVSSFQAAVTVWPDPVTGAVQKVVVKSDGAYGDSTGAARAIQLDFTRVPHTSSVFDYAVASKGQIIISKGSLTSAPNVDPKIATVLSSSATTNSVEVAGTVGGDISYVSGGSVQVSGGASVGGSTKLSDIYDNHVHEINPPAFPTIDTTVYKSLATGGTWHNGMPLKNVIIPAGTSQKFTGNQTIQGILYVMAPCSIEFSGDVKLQGIIVVQPAAGGNNNLNFTGNLTMSPAPNDPAYDAVRAATGVAIVAPSSNVKFWGSASGGNSDQYIKGSIIANTFTSGGASSLSIDQGSIMTLSEGPASFNKSGPKNIVFTATGSKNPPTIGVTYSSFFTPDASTYQEVAP